MFPVICRNDEEFYYYDKQTNTLFTLELKEDPSTSKINMHGEYTVTTFHGNWDNPPEYDYLDWGDSFKFDNNIPVSEQLVDMLSSAPHGEDGDMEKVSVTLPAGAIDKLFSEVESDS